MLQPSNRLTLIEAMRPPAGYSFDEAVAVTFTLDLRALLAAPAAFALAASTESEEDAAGQPVEPIELLHAIRRYSNRISVFSHAGEIALPPSRKVFAFLERSVVPVLAPRRGFVHPKVWVLTYVADGQPPRLRVLSASRNLTFDTSWDTLLRLDAADDGQGVALEPIADLFRRLPSYAVGNEVGPEHIERVERVCSILDDQPFALPDGIDNLVVHVLGLERTPSPLPQAADRTLIISPFVSDDFISKVHNADVTELVSRTSTLDSLKQSTIKRIGAPLVFDDGSTPEVEATEARLSEEDPGRPQRGLHAKVFAYETGDRARLYVGSANATGAAFSSNVEVLFELSGSKARLGIDALLSSSDDELGLRRLFQTYVREPGGPLEPSGGSLDATRRALGHLTVRGSAVPDGDGWVVRYWSDGPIEVPDEVTCECWPLASAGNRTTVESGVPLDVEFAVSVENISGFIAFSLADPRDDAVTSFVLPVQLDGVPEDRDRRLLRTLIGNAERFLRYLLALLAEQGGGEVDLPDIANHLEGANASPRNDGTSLPVLEALLRSLRRDPAKILAIDPLVRDLGADGALPPGFDELWLLLRDLAEVPV